MVTVDEFSLSAEIDMEISARVSSNDETFKTLTRWATFYAHKLLGRAPGDFSSETSPDEAREVGIAYEALMQAKKTWLNHLSAGRPQTALDRVSAYEWIAERAYKYQVRFIVNRLLEAGKPEVPSGLPTDDEFPPITVRRQKVFGSRPQDVEEEALAWFSPVLTVVRWASSGLASQVHILRMNPRQCAVLSLASLIHAGEHDFVTRSDKQTAAQAIVDRSGGRFTTAKVMRWWGEAVTILTQVLYMAGGLGPFGALRTDRSLDSCAHHMDDEYKGAWTGDQITLLKLAAAAATPTESGAEVASQQFSEFIDSNSGSAKQAMVILNRLAEPTTNDPLSILRANESEFNIRLNRARRPEAERTPQT